MNKIAFISIAIILFGLAASLEDVACVQVHHECAILAYSAGDLDQNGRVCVKKGSTVIFTVFVQTDVLARIVGGNTKTVVVNEDTTISFDCEYAVFVSILGNCNVSPQNGLYSFWPSDHADLTVTVTQPPSNDRQCRINYIKLNGNIVQQVSLTNIQKSQQISHLCECQVCVDISGDCVNNPSSRTCEYASDGVRLEVSVDPPVVQGQECKIDSILVDGNPVQEVVFDPLNNDHKVVTDCSCKPVCPNFQGCLNTDLYSTSPSKVYNSCECAKQNFDRPNGGKTQIVFCVPQGSTIKCDQNIYDGHLIWKFQAICNQTVVNYVNGKYYQGGSIVRKNQICYVAKWYTTEDPSTAYGLYQSYRYLGVC